MNSERIMQEILDLCAMLNSKDLEIIIGSIETMIENDNE